jgi:hypothetical protein
LCFAPSPAQRTQPTPTASLQAIAPSGIPIPVVATRIEQGEKTDA